MFEQDAGPGDMTALWLCLVGTVIGFSASSVFVVALLLGAQFPFWLIFPVYIGSAALAIAAAAALLFAKKHHGRLDLRLEAALERSIKADGLSIGRGKDWVDRFQRGCAVKSSDQNDQKVLRPTVREERETSCGDTMVTDRRIQRDRSVPKLDVIIGGGAAPRWSTRSDSDVKAARQAEDKAQTGGERGKARILPLTDTVVDRLFGRLVELRPEWVFGVDGVVGYLGEHNTSNLDAIARWAGPQCELISASSLEKTSWEEIEGLFLRAGAFFVDADFMGDLGETVDLCLRLRNRSPGTPLILISSEVRDHDLTAERAAICDATLKTPLTERDIQIGISAACENAGRVISSPVKTSRGQRSSVSSRAISSPRRRGSFGHLHQQ